MQNEDSMKHFIILLFTLLLLCVNTFVTAQHIKRKGKLGVQLTQAGGNAYGATFQIAKIFENSTAASLNMEVGDILLTVNKQPFNSGEAIKNIINDFVEGETVVASILRAGKVVNLSGIVVPPPLQVHSKDAEVILGEGAVSRWVYSVDSNQTQRRRAI